ncbi:glycosyltransferase WbuB [Escherichia albertii]|uniref:Predicted glycosyltransferase family 1_4 n=2 Tax=Escherichia TaxID=561 RepID=A0A5A4U4D6_ESCAL|nr:glycosyltransferase family 4 protein [Escherichia albertii]EEW4360379.1 glycosyltransferase WbuB [Escherichia albertii]EEW7551198.1 glycosyltransferase WbuB [Escherichia albertii]BBM62857.1 predicted glycosyltransferase family 1_4 [Escherichia albertii]
MRIALICDDYLPDSTRVSAKMMHELACEILKEGHDPIVFCPNGGAEKKLTVLDLDGVIVYRYPNGPTKDVSKIRRALNESLLSFNAWRFLSEVIRNNKIDGVIYYSPSIFFGQFVKKITDYWCCKSYLILRDSFPQWLVDQGIIRSRGILEKYFRFFENKNYKAASYIGVMSSKNKELFEQQYPDFPNVEVLYNWTDLSHTETTIHCNILTKLSLSDKIIFFYGGNIGHAQDMANLMRLAIGMRNINNVHFLFIGQGDEVGLVQRTICEYSLDNCTYLPAVSQEKYKSILKVVHVGLFSLAKEHSVHNFPGKLLGYMANKLPILGSVNEGNDLMEIVNDAQAGYVHINGNDNDLLSSAIKLADNLTLRESLGVNGHSLLQELFSTESAVKSILHRLQ